MIFSDTSTKGGLIQSSEQRIFGDEGYGRISGDTNLLYQFTNRFNRALDRYTFLSLTADGRWIVDDDNYTELSIAQTSLISGQNQYIFSSDQLEIEKILAKDASGNWQILISFGINDTEAEGFLKNGTNQVGSPSRYYKRGNVLFLDYTPNYNSSNGLKVFFKRGPSYYVYTDTTKVAGIPSIFHPFISLHADTEYGLDRNMAEAKNWFTRLQESEKAIQVFFSTRAKDEKPKMRPLIQNNK